jgi:hypothetical protein
MGFVLLHCPLSVHEGRKGVLGYRAAQRSGVPGGNLTTAGPYCFNWQWVGNACDSQPTGQPLR